MTYSTDLRRKVLSIKEQENLTTTEVAKRFGIGTANVSRWNKNLEPKRTRNKPATKIDMEALKRDVELHPDAYHHERAIRFNVTEGGIRKALKRLGISYKKNAETSQSQRRRTSSLPEKDEVL
jgi:transposase